MKKTLIAFAIMAATVGAFAHDQTLTNSASAGVSGSNGNYANTFSSGNGASFSVAGQSTGASAAANSTVYKAPGFNSSLGYGTTGGAISGATSTHSDGFAANVSVGGGTGNAGASGSATANADSAYNSYNNYVPLAVKQTGHADSFSGQVSNVGANGAAVSGGTSSNSYAGEGFATRLPFNIVAGNVSDVKNAASVSYQGGIGNVTALGNETFANTNVQGCFKAKSSGAVGGC